MGTIVNEETGEFGRNEMLNLLAYRILLDVAGAEVKASKNKLERRCIQYVNNIYNRRTVRLYK